MNSTHKRNRSFRCLPQFLLIGRLFSVAIIKQAAPQAAYMPVPVEPHRHAAYVRPDGTIQIVASSKLAAVIRALNTVFISTHPGMKLVVLEGDNYSAMAEVATVDSTLAPGWQPSPCALRSCPRSTSSMPDSMPQAPPESDS
jgi:hypothetical protein